MPISGATITAEKIKEILGRIPRNDLRTTEKFVNGDHWQDGAGWTGWHPESTSQDAQKQFVLVQRLFNAKNVCGGMVKRIRGAALGKEPDWEIVPAKRPEAEEASPPAPTTGTNGNGQPKAPTLSPDEKFYREIDEQLVKWWDDKKIHKVLKDFVSCKAAYGKAAIRIYVPPAYVGEGGTVTVKDFEDALDRIRVEVPHYENVIDALDTTLGRPFTILQLPKEDAGDPDRYEICHVDKDGKTHLRQVSETTAPANPAGPGAPAAAPMPGIDLGGNPMTIVDGEYSDALISPTVKAQQRSVNHAKTGENFALANINFPEITFFNADIPTETRLAADGKTTEEVPRPLVQGAGRWRNILGALRMDNLGGEQRDKPEMVVRDTADPKKFAEVADNNTRDMHQEVGMLYIYLADSEYASGDARIEAMTDYLILLVDTKTTVDNIGVWLLTTVLRLAFTWTNQTKRLEDFNVVFSTNLTIGRISNEDKKTMMEEVTKGLRSKRGYMVVAEVADDPDSELKVIAADGPLKDAQPNAIEVAEAQAKLRPATPAPSNGSSGAATAANRG